MIPRGVSPDETSVTIEIADQQEIAQAFAAGQEPGQPVIYGGRA